VKQLLITLSFEKSLSQEVYLSEERFKKPLRSQTSKLSRSSLEERVQTLSSMIVILIRLSNGRQLGFCELFPHKPFVTISNIDENSGNMGGYYRVVVILALTKTTRYRSSVYRRYSYLRSRKHTRQIRRGTQGPCTRPSWRNW